MALMPKTIELVMEFEPIVKLTCDATDCQFNLWNAATHPDNQMRACNLKQIIIGMHGQCRSFRVVPDRKKNES